MVGTWFSVAWYVGAMAVLKRMGKADPLLRQVYMRHIRYTTVLSREERALLAVPATTNGMAVSMRVWLAHGSRCPCAVLSRLISRWHAKKRTSENPRGLADLLLPCADRGWNSASTGRVLLAGWSYRGPDMMAASASEMAALSARFNQCLRLGSGWMVHCDAIRSQAPGYPEQGAFPDPVTRVIDDERREQFMAEGAHFESEYFLTLTYLPPVEAEERAKGWLFEGGSARAASRRNRFSSDSETGWTTSRTSLARCFRSSGCGRYHVTDDYGFTHDPRHACSATMRRSITGNDHPFALSRLPLLSERGACRARISLAVSSPDRE